MFWLLCFAIMRLLHYLLDTYMHKTIGWDILVISHESVAGNVVGMIRIIQGVAEWTPIFQTVIKNERNKLQKDALYFRKLLTI
jgi:hypothetical protein